MGSCFSISFGFICIEIFCCFWVTMFRNILFILKFLEFGQISFLVSNLDSTWKFWI
jgi:hypothetical protein